ENIALEIGRRLETMPRFGSSGFEVLPVTSSCARRVLHVATDVGRIGGVTPAIANWMANDPDSCHSLALVRQGDVDVPASLAEGVGRGGGRLSVFPTNAPLLARARWLRAIARCGADLVILHNLNDVVPTVAFATADGPPVGFANHSDQNFWLGSTVADAIVNL